MMSASRPSFSLLALLLLLTVGGLRAQPDYLDMGRRERDPRKKLEYLNKAVEQNPNQSAYFLRAYANDALGKINAAVNDFKRALDARPHPEPNLRVAETFILGGLCYEHYRIGQFQKAIRYGNRALQQFEKNEIALRFRAWSYVDLGQYENALRDFNRYVAMKPEDDNRYFQRAIAYYQNDNYEKALADLNKALKLNPDNRDYKEQKSLVLSQLGRAEEAEELTREIVDFKKKDPLSLANIGRIYSQNGEHETAIGYFQDALKLHMEIVDNNPNYAQEHKEDLFNIYINLGDAYMQLENYEKALTHYTNASNVRGESHLPWYKIGMMQNERRNFEATTIALERCFKKNPKYPYGWVTLGFAYGEMEKGQKAISTYHRALKVPNLASRGLILNNLGFSYLEADKPEQCRKYLTKAIEENPEIAMSHISMGEYYHEVKKYGQAIQKFEHALGMAARDQRETHTAYYKRGLSYLENGQLQKAIEDLETATSIELGHVEKSTVQAHETLGRAYFENGQLCKAQKAFKKAVKLDLEQSEFRWTEDARLYMRKISAKDKSPCD